MNELLANIANAVVEEKTKEKQVKEMLSDMNENLQKFMQKIEKNTNEADFAKNEFKIVNEKYERLKKKNGDTESKLKNAEAEKIAAQKAKAEFEISGKIKIRTVIFNDRYFEFL